MPNARVQAITTQTLESIKLEAWYFGNISRDESDQMLNETAETGDFMIRVSEAIVS